MTDDDLNFGDIDFDPEVAQRLVPMAEASPPELWADIAIRAAAGAAPTELLAVTSPGRRRSRPVLVALAAAAVVLLAVGGRAVRDAGDDQRVETPAATDDDAQGPPPGDTSAPDEQGIAGFPAGVEIGPDRGTTPPPVGAFEITYDAGTVIVAPTGEVLGHHRGGLPSGFPQRSDPAIPDVGGVPEGCELDVIFPYDSPAPEEQATATDALRVRCVRESGPTVEIVDHDGTLHPIASFPAPPADSAPDARVSGHLTSTYPGPAVGRGGPLLVQMSAECETSLAMMVDQAVWSSTMPDGGTIRHLDGTSYWDATWPDGESLALGWNGDGSEANVWRFNSVCSTPLAAPGVYAYRLDGTSRLVVPTGDEVLDVYQVPDTAGTYSVTVGSNMMGYTPVQDGSGASVLPDGGAAGYQSPDWFEWAGPLAEPATFNVDFRIDRAQILDFVARELGFTDPELALTVTEPASWIVTERRRAGTDPVSVRLTPTTWYRSEQPDQDALRSWDVEQADSFWGDDEGYLSASVNDDRGTWLAVFHVPTRDAIVQSTYQPGVQNLEPVRLTDGPDGDTEIVVDLLGEPTEPALLTISWWRDGLLVGYQRTVIPPGTFAAG